MAKQQQGNAAVPAAVPAKAEGLSLQEFLHRQRDRIAEVIPAGVDITPERMIKLASLAVHKNDDLHKCSRISILSAILEASSLGLEIGGPMAEAHLVRFGAECTLMVDYKGFLKLARQSGEFLAIEGVEVFEHDLFRVFRAPQATIQHELYLDGPRGPLKHVYAYAVLKDGGGIVFEAMNMEEVEKVRAISRSKDGPAWTKWYGQMAVKAVLKRLLKRQARSKQVARAVELDDREYTIESPSGGPRGGERGMAGVRSSLGLPTPEPEFTPGQSTVYHEDDSPPQTEEPIDEPGASG